jgi:hypothetical protein
MGFCFERVVVVHRPLKVVSVGNHPYKIRYTLATLLIALVFFSVLIVGSGVEAVNIEHEENEATNSSARIKLCVTKESWFSTIERVIFVDIVASIFLPFVVILVSSILISIKLVNMSRNIDHKMHACRFLNKMTVNSNSTDTDSEEKNRQLILASISQTTSSLKNHSNNRKMRAVSLIFSSIGFHLLQNRRKSYIQTTRRLLVVSFTFLILNTPLVISKMRYFYLNATVKENNPHTSSTNERILEHVSCGLFYLNFAINFLLYTFDWTAWRRFFC